MPQAGFCDITKQQWKIHMPNNDTGVWVDDTIFHDEPLKKIKTKRKPSVPAPIREARKLERKLFWHSYDEIFLKEGQLLADYEDNFEFNSDPGRLYPSYQYFSDEELRGYFTWRTKLRKNDYQEAPYSFIILNAYELINQIGVQNAQDGYEKLQQLYTHYAPAHPELQDYFPGWLADYEIYYKLKPKLLTSSMQYLYDNCLLILDNAATEEREKVIAAVHVLADKWLKHSRFFAQHEEDMHTLLVRVMARLAQYYATRCKRTFMAQYFGTPSSHEKTMFANALFADPLKRKTYTYKLTDRSVFKCKSGYWIMTSHTYSQHNFSKFKELVKTVDGIMREETGYGHPIKMAVARKWILNLICEECRALLAEKDRAQKSKAPAIDLAVLDKIREDAALTREKLIVDEEMDLPESSQAPQSAPPQNTADTGELSEAEKRLIHCLLYGGKLDWVSSEGHILSVMADAINEKLYNIFADSVMDDSPALIEDYIGDLKEMIPE